jgi:phosphonate transport system substrate-binding protein
LARLLTKKIGVDIQLVVPSSFANHVSLVRSGQVDFSYQNPVIFAKCMGELKGIGTAIKGGEDSFRGIIIVRKDSGIKKVEDLVGKSVCIVAPTSAGGFFSQKLYCLMNGVDLDKDCKVSVVPGNKQENVILNVFSKKVDVGFIRESALHRVDGKIDGSQIVVIAKTVPLPNWTFAANKKVPEHIIKRVSKILLSLGADSPALKAAKLDGFMKTDLGKFEGLRQLLNK